MLKQSILFVFIAFVVVFSGCSAETAKGEETGKKTKNIEKKGFPDKAKDDGQEADDEKADINDEEATEEKNKDETSEEKSKFKEIRAKKKEEKEETYIDENGKVQAEALLTSSELSEEEVYLMMIYMFEQVYLLSREVSDEHFEEFLSENREQAIQREAKLLAKPFSEYILTDRARHYAVDFLEWMNCECDGELPFELRFLHPGFKVLELNKDMIRVESLDVDGGLYGEGLKFVWELKKEDDKWKMSNGEVYNIDDVGDFGLTFEDIENSFFVSDFDYSKGHVHINRPVEFVEYFAEDGITYLAVYFPPFDGNDGYYEVYNTKLAALDFRFDDRYE